MLVSQLIMSIEDRGRWLGFHLRAALPFGSGSKFCEAALRVTGRLRVGVLGTAFAGEGHIAAYSRLPGVEVTGLWNRTKTRAESLARKLGYPNLTVYEDWQSLIGTGNCDVISIATAPMLRSDPLLAALDQGCHVLVDSVRPDHGHDVAGAHMGHTAESSAGASRAALS